MKNFRFRSLVGLGLILLFSLNVILLVTGLITDITGFIIAPLVLSVLQIMIHDLFSRKHSVLRNYPFRESFKDLLKRISRPISGLIFRDDVLKATVSSMQYELIVDRANNTPTDIVRSSLSHPDDPGFECLRYEYSNKPVDLMITDLRVKIGSGQCSQPYTLSVLNIGGLNQKVLSNSIILALSEGAKIQGCAVNTGKAGISPYLIRGGSDLIWQIAHEDYAFRREDSSFNEKLFKITATRPYVKMIEIVLPRHELSITKRIAGNRMMNFLKRLRDLSEGKPVGIRLYSPSREVIFSICKSMNDSGIHLDFITIDGSVSVSGFDSFSVSNAATPGYFESITETKKAISGYGLPTRIIASGAVVSEYNILQSIALGASACYCTAPMILAVNSKRGIGFKDPLGQRVRVANFHRNTVAATLKLMELCSYYTLDEVKPDDFYRKVSFSQLKSFREIYFENHPVDGPQLFSGLS